MKWLEVNPVDMDAPVSQSVTLEHPYLQGWHGHQRIIFTYVYNKISTIKNYLICISLKIYITCAGHMVAK